MDDTSARRASGTTKTTSVSDADTVADGRKRGWFWMHDSVLDSYGPKLGVAGLSVYILLARRANADGQCWPAHRSIADALGISRDTVIRKLALLQETGLISIEERMSSAGDHLSNLYTLLDPPRAGGGSSTTRPRVVAPQDQGSSTTRPRVVAPQDQGSSTSAPEGLHSFKGNTVKDDISKDSSSSGTPEDEGELSPELSGDCNLLSGWLASETGYSEKAICSAISAALRAGRDPYDIEDAIHGWLAHCQRRDGIKVPGALIAKRIRDGQLAPKEDRQRAQVGRGLLGPYSVLDAEPEEDSA